MPLTTSTPGLPNGIHYQASYLDYDATPAIRPSAVARGYVDTRRFSVAHYQQALSSSRPDTGSLLLGRLVHALVLEPLVAARTFIRMPDITGGLLREHPDWNPAGIKNRKDYREAVQAWEDSLPSGAVSVSPDIWDQAQAIADSALAADYLGPRILEAVPAECREVSLVWSDGGARLKRRSDAPHLELKTCRSLYQLERQIISYGYDIQLAAERWAWDALAQHGDTPEWILAVEVSPPYAAAILPASEELVAFGLERLHDAIAEIERAERSGMVHAASPGTDGHWGLPGWLRPSVGLSLGAPEYIEDEEG